MRAATAATILATRLAGRVTFEPSQAAGVGLAANALSGTELAGEISPQTPSDSHRAMFCLLIL
jgi:hypothetical protein